jgi:hypothetical protein
MTLEKYIRAILKNQKLSTALQGWMDGLKARALIRKNTWLGVYVNGNNPYTELEVEVLPSDTPSFSATVKGVISEKSLDKYQPGREIMVKYDPGDKSKVAIDHS